MDKVLPVFARWNFEKIVSPMDNFTVDPVNVILNLDSILFTPCEVIRINTLWWMVSSTGCSSSEMSFVVHR